MSILITNLAFAGQAETINASKMAILVASLTAGVAGFAWLKLMGAPVETDTDPDTIDAAIQCVRQARWRLPAGLV